MKHRIGSMVMVGNVMGGGQFGDKEAVCPELQANLCGCALGVFGSAVCSGMAFGLVDRPDAGGQKGYCKGR